MAWAQSCGSAVEHNQVVMAGSFEQAGCAHGAFAVPAHHHRRFVGHVGGPVRDVAEFDMHRAGQMPVEVLRALADVEDPAAVELPGAGSDGMLAVSWPAAVHAAMPPSSSPMMLS